MRWRITTLFVGFVALYALLVFHVYDIQFNQGALYLSKAETREKLADPSGPIRGNIYITDKEKSKIQAALNKEYLTIYAVPKEIQGLRDSEQIIKEHAEALSPLVGKRAEEIEKLLSKKNDEYEALKTKVDQQIVEQVMGLRLEGIYTKRELGRFYPFESLAAQIMGFVSGENEEAAGKYGAELQWNKKLKGTEAKEGESVELTIDRNIQAHTEDLLARLVNDHRAQGGTIIVQEAYSGTVVALANYPTFDPNEYSNYEIKNFINPGVQMIFEPGSVMKVITMAAGIESKKITPETTFVDTGSITLNTKKIENWDGKANGKQTMRGVLELSINTGAVFAEQKIGHDVFYNFLTKFGFSEPTGISLPGEVRGSIGNLKKGKDIDFATASFGQGVAVTPIELVSAVGAIANGGNLMRPRILMEEKQKTIRRVISEKTSHTVSGMMASVVKRNKIPDIPKYTVAGKTGTAYIPDFVKGGYTEEVINSFVGFAPATTQKGPKYVILLKLDKPEGSPLAASTVGPAFKDLMQFVLNYYNIPPDAL